MKMPENYSINMLWVNRELNSNQPYLCGNNSLTTLPRHFIEAALKWKKSNPNASVVIWYDGYSVNNKAQDNTLELLSTYQYQYSDLSIMFKDFREIDVVKNNPDIFSDYLPVYYRVDLLKLILCVHTIEYNHDEASIYADLQVGDLRVNKDRMGKDELFKREILERLEYLGLQVIKDGMKDENQFYQMVHKPEILKAVKVYINASMARAEKALNLEAEKWL